MKIAVIGSGSWGCAAAILTAKKGNDVYLWSWKLSEAELLERERENRALLPGAVFPDNIVCSNDMELCVRDAELIVTVVPSPATRETAKRLAQYVKKGQIIVNLSKGLEESTLKRLSEVYESEIPQAEIAVMSGPSHAEEVSLGLPTTIVAAARNIKTAEYVQEIFMNEEFRVYTSDDVTGVETGGALKNVIALCAGIADGIGYGDNTRAALITRGIAEIKRLGLAMGASPETFAGLSGIGDLIVTCTSVHSRNHRAGVLLGKGLSLEETLAEVKMVVEGVNTARAAYKLSEKFNVRMPITEEAYKVLFDGKDPKSAVTDLMTRTKASELE